MKDGLLKIGEGIAGIALDNLQRTVNMLSNLASIVSDLINKDWNKLGADIKIFFSQWKDSVENAVNLKGATGAAKTAGDKVKEEGGSDWEQFYTEANHFVRNLPVIGNAAKIIDTGMVAIGAMDQAEFDSYYKKPEEGITGTEASELPTPTATPEPQATDEKKKKPWWKFWTKDSVEDGIMRPDGTITRVAPDDWVFAARNVEDLAAAFIPQGVSNTMNAPASYVINQNINVNGGNNVAAAVRQQAYNGANEAMLRSMSNSQRLLQLMPGQR